MFGNRARIGLAALALSGAVLTASAFAGAGEAQAFGGYELKVKLGYEVTGTLKVVVAEA